MVLMEDDLTLALVYPSDLMTSEVVGWNSNCGLIVVALLISYRG